MNYRKTVAASLLTLAGFTFAAPFAWADAAKTVLEAADTDHDGSITLDEAKAAAATTFASLDKDNDGTIDAKEAKGMPVKKIDGDKDGTVDKAEYMAAVEAAFKKADPDGDGKVDAKELKSPAGKMLLMMIKPAK